MNSSDFKKSYIIFDIKDAMSISGPIGWIQKPEKSAGLWRTSRILAALCLISLMFGFSLPVQAQAWLNSAWLNRTAVSISNPNGTTLTNFQVKVSLDGTFDFAHAQSKGEDLRVTAGDGVTQLPFWIADWRPANPTATIWVQVPSIPSNGAGVWLYYGNAAAASASNGRATFSFFDDFEPSATTLVGYFPLSAPQTILVEGGSSQVPEPHTMSIVQANSGGFTYAAYIGQGTCGGIGMSRSSDLSTWQPPARLDSLPADARWPSVLLINGIYYMAYEANYCTNSYIALAESSDGIRFTTVKTLVSTDIGLRNQNPNLFFNPNDQKVYLYWFRDEFSGREVRARSAASVEALSDTSSEVLVIRSTPTMAAPNMLYFNGLYFLSTETFDANGQWATRVLYSSSPTSGFQPVANGLLVSGGNACMSQTILGNVLHTFFCTAEPTRWTVTHRTAPLTLTNGIDSTLWNAGTGEWTVVSDLQQDGTMGRVLNANLSSTQSYTSTFSGTDYVVEGYGRQMSGRVWGIGARAGGNVAQYSADLYRDLGPSGNLYTYRWQNGTTSLAIAAGGIVQMGVWYNLSIKVHGNQLDTYKDGVLKSQAFDGTYQSGGVGFDGQAGTVAQFNNIFVRRYAPLEPVASLGTPAPPPSPPPSGGSHVNVALAANGATATASSFYNAAYGPSGTIDGERRGIAWSNGGGWNDLNASLFPDWLQVDFARPQAIDEVDVFTVQDNYQAPIDPTPSTSFNLYGITDFQVQYWDGSNWVAVPGGSISGNNKIWRQMTFPAITTSRIRVFVTGALNAYSRITEVEAYALNSVPGSISKSSPSNGANGQSAIPLLSWGTSGGATSYEYCVDTINNGVCDTNWISTTNTSAAISGLNNGTNYSWQVRARNNSGTTDADGGTWWAFTTAPAGPINVAAAANGASASASSFANSGYPASSAINGDRKGIGWGSGTGGWNDGTQNQSPDILQINFASAKTISEIDVFTLQDNYQSPVDPTPTMTFSLYGITDFQVQYWDGFQWLTVQNGNIIGNRLVWQKISFPAVSTTGIRVVVNGALNSWSRIVEVEAY